MVMNYVTIKSESEFQYSYMPQLVIQAQNHQTVGVHWQTVCMAKNDEHVYVQIQAR